MALPFAFSNNTSPTGPQLDADLQQLGEQSVRPCTAAGTNSITLALNANVSAITAYANYQRFSAVAAATNTGAVQARVGSLPLLNVYRDTPAGPVALAGGEIVINCAFVLTYDNTLNTGTGGFHLLSQANAFPYTGGTISNGSITLIASTLSTVNLTGASISGPLLIGSTLSGSIGTLSKLSVGASAASITRVVSQLGTLVFSLIAAQTAQDQPMTLVGAQLGDSLSLGYSVGQTNTQFSGYIPAAGTVNVRALNAGAGTLGAFTLVARATAHGFT